MDEGTRKDPDPINIEIDIEAHHNKAMTDKSDSITAASSKKVVAQACVGLCVLLAFV